MYDFHPYFTADGSVGLYSPEYKDIYHSATGALTEAKEKFIDPINFSKLLKKDSIKVLDICFGIGYNSKSFFQKLVSLIEHNIDTIHTNNPDSDSKILSACNNAICGDNIFPKISVTAVDNDKILAFLSPFIKTGEKHFKTHNFGFEYKNLEKYYENAEKLAKPKIENFINFLIFDKIAKDYPEICKNSEVRHLLTDKNNIRYFDNPLKEVYKLYKNNRDTNAQICPIFTNLHNIYYSHVTKRYKNRLKRYNLQDLLFNLKIGDARGIIKKDENKYNLIFLDAFTPSKCPNLWSYEFFKLLYEHLEQDGILLTYSSSASVRGAMMQAGFYIGNNFNTDKNLNLGTIAAKEKNLIKFPLSEYDLGLLKTTAGIFYRDENLTGQNEAIIKQRKFEVNNSTRISSSKYKKLYYKD